jgi:hypothetical protein
MYSHTFGSYLERKVGNIFGKLNKFCGCTCQIHHNIPYSVSAIGLLWAYFYSLENYCISLKV